METKHRNATPGMALAVTTQPAGRVSIASFPGGNSDEQEQHMPRASNSCNDGLARSWPQVERVNPVKAWAANQQQLQPEDDPGASTFKSILLSIILPNIPHTSQNEHSSIQWGGENDLQMSSWSKPVIPYRSNRLTRSICLGNSAPVQACPSNTQHPILHLSKYNTMTAGEDHQENGDDLFFCMFKNVLMDHLGCVLWWVLLPT